MFNFAMYYSDFFHNPEVTVWEFWEIYLFACLNATATEATASSWLA